MKKISTTILLISLIITISACTGWRLRGSDTNAVFIGNSIYLSGQNSATYRLVEEQLNRKNALTSLTAAQYFLVLEKEDWDRRSASVTRTAVTAEYELTLSVNYKILDNNQAILRPTTDVKITRSYTFDQNDVAGKDKEEELIRKEIRRAVARQILQQIQLLQR
ncbi:MAG: LPS assembly lipoprotein LptE [Cellvibrionaceae bacterium]